MAADGRSRRWIGIALAACLAIFAYNLIADRLTPYPGFPRWIGVQPPHPHQFWMAGQGQMRLQVVRCQGQWFSATPAVPTVTKLAGRVTQQPVLKYSMKPPAGPGTSKTVRRGRWVWPQTMTSTSWLVA
jgi:hypothetical protein